jgi:phytoene dehydrogenase-like protein
MGKTIVVIGSGVGGSAVAALLAKAGHSVTLLEAHSFAGGRCSSFEKDGFCYDFGVHMFGRGSSGPLGEVNRRLDGRLKWQTRDPSCRVMGKVEFDFPLDISPLSRQIYLARKLGVKVKNLWGAFRLFRALVSGRDHASYDNQLLHDYVSRFTNDENIHLFMNLVAQLFFALSYQEASAGEFIWCFSRLFQDANGGYPEGGSRAIPGSFLERLAHFGGSIKYNEPVTRIIVTDDRVQGVETAGDTYPADLVIANCGLPLAIQLAGAEHFPDDYVRATEKHVYTNPYVTIKYALNAPVIPYPMVLYMPDIPAADLYRYIDEKRAPDDPYIFMPVPSNLDPSTAPAGKQLVVAGTPAPPGASRELCQAVLEKVDNRVRKLFPGIDGALIWELRSTADDIAGITKKDFADTIGLGQVPGQVGANRPDCQTPVNGLWLVGADAGARGIGTEMAAGSALALADRLMAEV